MLPESLLYFVCFWLTTILAGIFIYLKFFVYTYWKRHGVPHELPKMPFGNILPVALGKISLGNYFKESYDKLKNHRFHGIFMFHKPLLMINDPELIRHILVKDFNQFCERGLYCNKNVDPLSYNLFLMPGEKWRQLRTKFSTMFTPSKLREIFPLIEEISDQMKETCDYMLLKNDIVEIKDLIARYTTDSISSIAFGFNSNSLNVPENDFKRYAAMVFNQNPFINALAGFAPIILDILHIPFFNRRVTHFFIKSFKEMVAYRKQTYFTRKDILNLLMQLMDKGVLDNDAERKVGAEGEINENRITMTEAQSQAFLFFLAGFETTSSTIAYLLYEIAINQDIQEKLHQEIKEFLSRGKVTYDRINNELKYLNMVFSETLRKHAVFGSLNRMCVEDYRISNSDFVIRKGTGIIIPVSGLHHDPDIYPHPEKFDPTRFSKENIATRSPYVYLPFGSGPRNCIGARLGELQSKIPVILLISNYKFFPCEKTVIPIEYSKRSVTQTAACGIYLRVEKRVK